MSERRIGVEEELLLVDPASGRLKGVAERATRADTGEDAPVEHELFRQQVETMTDPMTTLDDLARGLCEGRAALCAAAEQAGAVAVASGTPVLDGDPDITRRPRYEQISQEYGELARSGMACAMHVHVDIADDEEGVRVLDGIQPWLPLLLAISANSPFHEGRDTGHASWRAQVWDRWPSHGTLEPFGSVETYYAVTERMTEWGAALDDGMIYFDTRLSSKYPTVEVRLADVTPAIDDAVLVAALARALVHTVAALPERPSPWRSEMLRVARWRAARYGLAGRLVDPATATLLEPRAALGSLQRFTADALAEAGDTDTVADLVEQVLARGNGAVCQRRVAEEAGSLEAVVADLARRTRSGR